MATPSPKKQSKKVKAWEWSPVNVKDVVVVTQGHQMLVGGEELTEVEVRNLQAEVKTLKAFRIWGLFQETVKQKAIETGFVKSVSWEQTMSGKMMLHNLGILDSIVQTIEKANPPHAPVLPPLHKQPLPHSQ